MTIELAKKKLLNIFGEEKLMFHEPMKHHTSFKIGGEVDVLILPTTVEDVKHAMEILKDEEVDYYVMGNGSNILVKDSGIEGAVIKLGKNFSGIEIAGERLIAKSGILLSEIANRALDQSLKGFEFASGIPGTIGGAMVMNAGAYGGEMKDVVETVTVLTPDGEIKTFTNEEMNFGYRTSIIGTEGHMVLEVVLKLESGEYDEIKAIVDDLTSKRTTKQPLHLPSAGSTFKRPLNNYAGKLIDEAGLRGIRVGGAQVSELHCGFVVNVGNATAEDVLNLMKLVQKVVYDKFDVKLEPEVKLFGVKA